MYMYCIDVLRAEANVRKPPLYTSNMLHSLFPLHSLVMPMLTLFLRPAHYIRRACIHPHYCGSERRPYFIYLLPGQWACLSAMYINFGCGYKRMLWLYICQSRE